MIPRFERLCVDVQKLDGIVDPSSLHGGCKVLSGEKWSSTKWMRQRAFE
jgi:hypothetical protein